MTELQTFEYNAVTKKAQAQKGKHDDAILSMCMALYVRESISRDVPIGLEERNREDNASIKSQVYEEIKKEIDEMSIDDLEEEEIDLLAPDMDNSASPIMNEQRKNNNILREFDW